MSPSSPLAAAWRRPERIPRKGVTGSRGVRRRAPRVTRFNAVVWTRVSGALAARGWVGVASAEGARGRHPGTGDRGGPAGTGGQGAIWTDLGSAGRRHLPILGGGARRNIRTIISKILTSYSKVQPGEYQVGYQYPGRSSWVPCTACPGGRPRRNVRRSGVRGPGHGGGLAAAALSGGMGVPPSFGCASVPPLPPPLPRPRSAAARPRRARRTWSRGRRAPGTRRRPRRRARARPSPRPAPSARR